MDSCRNSHRRIPPMHFFFHIFIISSIELKLNPHNPSFLCLVLSVHWAQWCQVKVTHEPGVRSPHTSCLCKKGKVTMETTQKKTALLPGARGTSVCLKLAQAFLFVCFFENPIQFILKLKLVNPQEVYPSKTSVLYSFSFWSCCFC